MAQGEGEGPAPLPWPAAATSPELAQRVAEARVLAVGAGGIGCELLKSLVMSGFKHIEVVDMDTIETSNLNRQFLFRKRHVGGSKAEVAAAAVQAMRPGVQVLAYQANIKEPRFGPDFFRRFSLVLNGLDNLDARRHVNRLCLAAGVPLVESGTAGYLGQVSVHLKGVTECFECQPKPAPKSFPVCTLRNTPDKPIHCVVWAKEMLFPLLFGAPEASDLNEGGAAAAAEDGEAAAGTPEDPLFYQRREGESGGAYAERVLRQQYAAKIEEVRGLEDLWRSRRPPEALDIDAMLAPPTAAAAGQGAGAAAAANGAAAADAGPLTVGGSAAKALGLSDAHAAWDARQCAALFVRCVRAYLEERPGELGAAVFDKDDALAVEFVAAAANLRAACYGIPRLSLFDIKGMAGNIIHAIATTNAIVSGLIVVEALKLLAGAPAACQTSFLHQQVSGANRLVSRMAAPPPAPGCVVCGTAQVVLAVDARTMTLQQLVDKVLKGRLALVAPWLSCGSFTYEEGEDLDEDEVAFNRSLLPRTLAALPGGGLAGGSVLEVLDQEQQLKAHLLLEQRDEWDEAAHPDRFELLGPLPEAQAEEEPPAPATEPAAPAVPRKAKASALKEDEDGAVLLSDSEDEGPATEVAAAAAGRGKRKADAGEQGEGGPGKRARGGEAGGDAAADDVVDLLDSD